MRDVSVLRKELHKTVTFRCDNSGEKCVEDEELTEVIDLEGPEGPSSWSYDGLCGSCEVNTQKRKRGASPELR
jgi:hypothetical protein